MIDSGFKKCDKMKLIFVALILIFFFRMAKRMFTEKKTPVNFFSLKYLKLVSHFV